MPEPPTFVRRHATKLAASVVITASLVWAMKKGGLKFIPEGGNFDHVRWWTVPAYLLTLTAMNYFRATRWRYLLRSFADVPTRRLVEVSWIGFAAILLLPFRIGEFVRPFMLRTPGKRDEHGNVVGAITMAAATGTVVAERIVDAVYLSAVLVVALVAVPHLEPLPDKVVGLPVSVQAVRDAGFMMFGIFLVAFAVIAVYYAARDFARRATFAVFGLVSTKLAEKLSGMAEGFADGLRFLGRGRDAVPFLIETSLYWLCNVLGMWLLAWGCGVVHADGTAITFGESCALMGMLGITILIPGPPGLLGVFQLGIYAGMTMYFPTHVVSGEGAAYVFLIYICQFAWQVVAGGYFFFTDREARHRLEDNF
jgi:uncharacterized protein (TIRG00374 family)